MELEEYFLSRGVIEPLNSTINRDFMCLTMKHPWLTKENDKYFISIYTRLGKGNNKIFINTIDEFEYFKKLIEDGN